MTQPKMMIAVDPDILAGIQQELAALRSEIRAVRLVPAPEWVSPAEYAKTAGVTRHG